MLKTVTLATITAELEAVRPAAAKKPRKGKTSAYTGVSRITKSVGDERTSQYRGVSLRRSTGKWQARIRDEAGKQLYVGSFQHEEQAARARDRAAIILRGRKAVTNFNLGEYGELLRASPEERRAMAERLASGAALSRGRYSTATGRRKAGSNRKASKPDLGAPHASGVQAQGQG